MTMTKHEINDLIEEIQYWKLKDILNNELRKVLEKTQDTLDEYRDSLGQLDVLQHLRDGGAVTVKGDNPFLNHHFRYNGGVSLISQAGYEIGLKTFIEHDWQPCKHPVENMLEDGCWYWVLRLGSKFPCLWCKDKLRTGSFEIAPGHYHSIEKGRCEPILRDGKPIKVEVPE